MGKLVARGAVVNLTISASPTAIGQIRSVRIGDTTSDVLQGDTLDDSGVGHDFINAKTATQDDITGEMYYDPDNTGHMFITDTIAAPTGFPVAGTIQFTDPTPASASFSAIGFGFGATINVNELLVGNFTFKCDGVVSWPT